MLATDLGTNDSALEQSFDDAEIFALEALPYDRPLADLGLPSGTLEEDPAADVLDEPDSVYTTEIRDARVGDWTRTNRWSETVAAFHPKRLERRRCPRYET